MRIKLCGIITVYQSSMETGDDEPCNWCGAVEVVLVQAANEEDRGKGNVVSGGGVRR